MMYANSSVLVIFFKCMKIFCGTASEFLFRRNVRPFFFHKQHVRLFVLPKVMRLPSGCETDYKHCGPVQCKLWYLSPKWSLGRPNLKRVWENGIGKIPSVNDFEIRTPVSCLVILRFYPLYIIFILCYWCLTHRGRYLIWQGEYVE